MGSNYPQQPGYTPQPPYGQPQPYGQPGGYAQPKMNVLAIVGFIFAFLFSLIGLILSIIALVQINNSNGAQKGKGLALAGIILSVVFMLISLLAIIPNMNS